MVLHKDSLWARMSMWAEIHGRLSVVLVISMLALSAGVAASTYFYAQPGPQVAEQTPSEPTSEPKPALPVQKYYSPLTGVEVSDQAATKRQVTAVMIEN